MSFAAITSKGGRWPDGTQAIKGNVLIWSGEDDPVVMGIRTMTLEEDFNPWLISRESINMQCLVLLISPGGRPGVIHWKESREVSLMERLLVW
jgi:hypothetical protein